MAIKTFTDNTSLSASDINSFLANSGLVFVKQVTVGSAVSTVNITSCFSSTFINYVISFNGIAATVNGTTINFKLLQSSTATTLGFYGNTFYVISGAAGGLTNANFANQSFAEMGSMTTGAANTGIMQLQSPFAAEYTRAQFMNSDNNYLRWSSSYYNGTTSFDGIQILPGGGTMTGGKITIYGYRLE